MPTANPNYAHECNANKVKKEEGGLPLSFCFTPEQIAELFRFYVLEAPTAKGGITAAQKSRSLKQLGWSGKKLNELERKLLRASAMQSIVILGSSSLAETLKSMSFTNNLCIEHPRCLLQRPTKLKLQEDGQVKQLKDEVDTNRMQCLFRHMRNSFAHGNIQIFENRMVLLEDYATGSDSGQTAAILISSQALLDWIEIVETEGKVANESNAM